MSRSLRDELLKAGLVTREQAARVQRRGPPKPRPAGSKVPKKPAGRSRGRGERKNTTKQWSRVAADRQPGAPESGATARPAPDERVRQLNTEIRGILDAEAEPPDPQSDTPFHFARGDRLKRLYVSESQRRRLAGGELAIVGFGGRHHLVPYRAGERVRELREEVFVFIATASSEAETVEEGYEGFEIPDGLVW